jgi:predicted nucleotidyltransferase
MAAEREPIDDPLSRALDDVVAVLAEFRISYALIGGLATGYRSRPRYTRDIDLILDIPQVSLPAVLEALHDRGFEFESREVIEDFTRHHMAVLWRDGVRLDWLKPMLPAYRHVLDQARLEPGPTVAIRVATAEGLILLKLLAFRLQDQTDIESLVAANRDAIDVEWIKREWQTIFDLDDPRILWLLGQIKDSPRVEP